MPDLQAGLGALVRLRALLAAEPEPVGGSRLPEGALDSSCRPALRLPRRHFALQDVDLTCRRATTSRWSGAAARASPPSPRCCRAPSSPSPARCCWAASTSSTSTSSGSARRSAWSPSAPRSSPARWPRTSRCSPTSRAGAVQAAVDELGLTDWVAGLPDGLDTVLGPGGTTLSAGEEQLVAFARLLVRDVRVVVLDEATARMDPVTEAGSCAAADRLLTGRTGILVAHRLTTTARAEHVAVLERGRVVQQGRAPSSRHAPGPFRRPARRQPTTGPSRAPADVLTPPRRRRSTSVGTARRTGRRRPPPPELRAAARAGPGIWTRCSSTRSGGWPAWLCSWSPSSSGPSAPSPAGCGAPRRLAARRVHPGPADWRWSSPRCSPLRRCSPRRSAATRAGGSR